MSTYYNSIPQGTDNPSDSQPLLLSNFQAIFDAQNRNHVSFTDTSNSGRHTTVQMQEQASDPSNLADYGTLYTKDDSGTQLYFMNDAGTIYQLTNDFKTNTNGELTLPGGLGMKWGLGTAPNANDYTLTYTAHSLTAFSNETLNVQVTVSKTNSTGRVVMVADGSLTSTGFTVRNNNDGNSINFYWFALGY